VISLRHRRRLFLTAEFHKNQRTEGSYFGGRSPGFFLQSAGIKSILTEEKTAGKGIARTGVKERIFVYGEYQ
jgi:hypothetical protein